MSGTYSPVYLLVLQYWRSELKTLGRAEASPEMGTWGEAERVVQPTDLISQVGFRVFWRDARAAEERTRCTPSAITSPGSRQYRSEDMFARLVSGLLTVTAIADSVLAGGASLRII